MIISAGVENLTSWERKLLYMCNARPTINTRALFSDATNDYRCPAEPMPGDTVKIRLRTGRYNVDKAYIYVNNVEYPMTKIKAVEYLIITRLRLKLIMTNYIIISR